MVLTARAFTLSLEIIFELFQPVRKSYLNVTDRQTDRQTTYCGITMLCVASQSVVMPHECDRQEISNKPN